MADDDHDAMKKNTDEPPNGDDTDATVPASATSSSSSSSEAISSLLPIRLVSVVVKGFGRGSKDLGIPTANLSREDGTFRCGMHGVRGTFDDLPCGIYWGYARIGDRRSDDDDVGGGDESGSGSGSGNGSLGVVHKAAISIGYNPTYGNDTKTVEPHLIASPDDPRRHLSKCGETLFGDFYGEKVRLSVVGYLRPELPFEGLEKLVEAIKRDIVMAEHMGGEDEGGVENNSAAGVKRVAEKEERWVESDDDNVFSDPN